MPEWPYLSRYEGEKKKMKKATFIKVTNDARVIESSSEGGKPQYAGPCALYKLSEPMAFGAHPAETGGIDKRVYSEYVIVSCGGVRVHRPETYTFASSPEGTFTPMDREGPGSFQGAWNMRQALIYAGYELDHLGKIPLPDSFEEVSKLIEGVKLDDESNLFVLR